MAIRFTPNPLARASLNFSSNPRSALRSVGLVEATLGEALAFIVRNRFMSPYMTGLAITQGLLNAGVTVTISSATASGTVATGANLILADATTADIDMTLPVPSAINAGFENELKKIDSGGNRVGFIVASSGTIDGATRKYRTIQGDSIRVKQSGSAWVEL